MDASETDLKTVMRTAAEPPATEMPSILDSLAAVKTHVADITEPDFGLLEELLKLKVVTRRQLADIRSERTVYRRNDAMLDCLKSEEQCSKFLTALQSTGQTHVINYVRYREGARAQCGDVRPLDEARMLQLTVNGTQLVDRIDSNTVFVTEFANAGCITWRQREHIANISQPRDRNDKLLEFLTRRSVADFNKFTDVLGKHQPHLARLLLTDGVTVSVDAELDESSVDDVSQAEDRIVSRWEELISPRVRQELRDKVKELDQIAAQVGLGTRIVLLERRNSIAMCFICMLLDALTGLREQWHSGQLKRTVESLFTLLLDARRTVRIRRLSWPQADYDRCLTFFIRAIGSYNW